MKKEVQEFLESLDETDVMEFKEFLEGRKSRKWVFRHAHYLIKGTAFLIASWMAFETFLKHIFTKLFS